MCRGHTLFRVRYRERIIYFRFTLFWILNFEHKCWNDIITDIGIACKAQLASGVVAHEKGAYLELTVFYDRHFAG